jgi:hypothetical protein
MKRAWLQYWGTIVLCILATALMLYACWLRLAPAPVAHVLAPITPLGFPLDA